MSECEECAKLQEKLDEIKNDDINQLTEISKKLSKTLKEEGEDEMLVKLMQTRAKILDHFILAYMGETGIKPSQAKLVQGFNQEGYVEMYFQKKTELYIPGGS